jgi:hypothetical protein
MKKSIYISIACLGYDTELERTISSALEGASKNNKINIGIAFAGNKKFYKDIKNKYKNFSNVHVLFSELKNAFGVGKGRILSSSMYNEEDYFLQVDAHTLFSFNWDQKLINDFEKAKVYVKNDKVVLSATLPQYWYEEDEQGEKIVYDEYLGYTVWVPNEFLMNAVPKFTYMAPHKFSENLFYQLKNNNFAPASKIMGMFIFGDKKFAKNLCIDSSIIFWEEEIFQSIELINQGFTLVHPGIISPLLHFHYNGSNQKHYRENFDIFEKVLKISLESYAKQVKENYYRLANLQENKEKIRIYEEYSGINILFGTQDPYARPIKFINSNSDIICLP